MATEAIPSTGRNDMLKTMYRPLTCLLILLLLGVTGPTANAQAEKPDPYWRQFDKRYPELAGKGESLWEKAGQLAKLQVGEADQEAFATRQNLVFHALAVNERDHVIIAKKAKTREEHEWIAERRAANMKFQKDVDTIKALRAKPDDQLTQDDMKAIVQASISLMSYIYESQIQANEAYFETVIDENQTLRNKLDAATNHPKPKPETESTGPTAGSRKAERGDFKAYLQSNRIRINDEDDGGLLNRNKEYDRNHVQITGAIKNQTDKPARFSFQVVGLRANKQVVGLKTIQTPLIAPGGVHEIDARMPVEHSAYVRSVDMREVKVIQK